jgi:creatinine amidohydrolase
MVTRMTNLRLHRLAHISWKTLGSLNRDQTIVMLPVGMMETHGEHLPLGTDDFAVEAMLLAAAAWLLEENKSLHVLMMPSLPYGTDPVDSRRPDLFSQAGSVWVAPDTLKALVRDVCGHMIRYGFRAIFPVSFHGGAGQMIALEEVCSSLRSEVPGLVMWEPTGYVMAGAASDVKPGLATLLGRPLKVEEEVALRGSVHASMFETSMMLHLRPDLVDPSYKHLRTIEWGQLYKMKDWPGYVGAGPSHADAELGSAMLRWRGVRAGALMLRAVEGEDLSALPRHPSWKDEPESISEAPRDDELPNSSAGEADSKPAMYISRREISEARDYVRAQREGVEEDPQEHESRDQVEEDEIATPTATAMDTGTLGVDDTGETPPQPE